jgi:putative ABC transport system permease protein
VESIQHRFAYLGTDLQDFYGVRPTTIVAGAHLEDTWFAGGSADGLARRLQRRPDGVLVSAETVRDFQLHSGDPITLRLRDARSNHYVPVQFHYVGVVKEFPSAPRDSFLVANAAYVARATGSDAVGAFLVDTGNVSPHMVANQLRARLGPTVKITDIRGVARLVGSTLTSVDLSGLTRIELGFALALAAASTALVFVLGFAERRRTVALAAVLGARPRQLGGFIWSEAAFVSLGGVLAGAMGGWVLSVMLVKVLTGVFDPPPTSLAFPFLYLAGVMGVALVAVAISAGIAARTTRRPALDVIRA